MARDTMTYESYEPDSFDNPPKGPVGVHRGARSVMARLCPFIVVILVAALFSLLRCRGLGMDFRRIQECSGRIVPDGDHVQVRFVQQG